MVKKKFYRNPWIILLSGAIIGLFSLASYDFNYNASPTTLGVLAYIISLSLILYGLYELIQGD